ncbi:hypothetical protein V4890_15735 [Ralstonia solanacearum species complex bacterium KE056]|uniref:hypothetical protein n=1 Tax=Ralstonia solanacearum species complex bacterium KE056 TaxID=3119585 RepID=UPI002FC3ADA8
MLRFLLRPRSRQNSGPAKRKTSHTPGFIKNGSAVCSQRGIGTPESATANHHQDAEHLNNTDFTGACLAAAALSSACMTTRRTDAEKMFHETWTTVAIPISAPFAVAEQLPSPVRNAISILIKAEK